MSKTLRTPERAYSVLMWVVSFVFAGFLIGLGGKIIGDLRGAGGSAPTESEFADQAALREVRARLAAGSDVQTTLEAAQRTAQVDHEKARSLSASAQQSFTAWIATRNATGDPAQDVELKQRTQELERLRGAESSAKRLLIDTESQLAEHVAALQRDRAAEERLVRAGGEDFRKALFAHEVKVFMVRLLFTLPLLLIAGWMVMKQRSSRHWPLMRGFVVAAAFAFFVELVPYLPTWGGYIRFIVGIVITGVAGHYAIRWMQGYLARRQLEAQRSEAERRSSMDVEAALRKMANNVCPGCERGWLTTGDARTDYCCHCGLNLFDNCGGCGVRKNAYFRHCMGCGLAASTGATGTTLASPVPAPGGAS